MSYPPRDKSGCPPYTKIPSPFARDLGVGAGIQRVQLRLLLRLGAAQDHVGAPPGLLPSPATKMQIEGRRKSV